MSDQELRELCSIVAGGPPDENDLWGIVPLLDDARAELAKCQERVTELEAQVVERQKRYDKAKADLIAYVKGLDA